MFTECTSFRPRNGECAEAYWMVRGWCDRVGFSFSDVLNAIMIPLAYHLENHCTLDHNKNVAYVDLTIGTIPILHVFQGKLYPLRKDADHTKDHINSEGIKNRIDYWKKKNSSKPTQVDKFLKDIVLKK